MKKLVVLLLVSLMATSALAVMDPDDNGIGVYFDLDADVNASVQAFNVPFQAYVMITNPTNDISGLEVGYEVAVAPGFEGLVFRLGSVLPVGAVDLGTSTNILLGDYAFGIAAPLPAAPAVVLVHWTFMILSPGMTMEFYLGPSAIPSLGPVPAYEGGGVILELQQSSGGPGAAVACVNSCTPVAVENASFGNVKSLFR